MTTSIPVYPLAEVLNIKNRRVEQAEAVVKEKKAQLAIEQQKLLEREKERDAVKAHYTEKLVQYRAELDAGTTSAKIHQCKMYLKVVMEKLQQEEKKVLDQKKQVANAEEQVQQAIAYLKEREKERDKIITHRKEWTKAENKLLEIQETRNEDELGSLMFLTKMIKDRQEQHKA